jgi:arabinofuranan 3-O-arabinosyltransferase
VSDPTGPSRTRIRVLATCLVLVGLAFVQDAGLLAADTKLDLATDPAGFLARSLHLWDDLGASGQLQNQAYGYLWPMGPFFLLGGLLDLPGWVVQRSWMALVSVVAFAGAERTAREFGVRSDLAAILVGVAYALSPRMLTTLGPISIEAWPSALAPWVLLPLVRGAVTGSPRRAAALSALAVAMVGGVNAAATFAVLPLGVVWLLTRSPGARRTSMMLWWPVFTVLGTVWWLVPLFVLGQYSPPFLDFIESAANTTFSTTVFDSLRGTSDWVPYVDSTWRAGNDLIRTPSLVVDSGAVLLLGLGGLVLPRNPHRGFLALSLLTGMVLVTAGHVGAVQGWVAPGLQELLDGALAPLRNVHKFDPVVRLPLVLGMGLLVQATVDRLRRESATADRTADRVGPRINERVLVGTAILAVLGAAVPVLAGRITPAGAFPEIPDHWAEAADWLDDQPGAALVVPGSSFGEYVWGSPHDEPMQSLATSPWAVRNAIPLTPAGNIRMLDEVERRLSQGRGSVGLTAYLARAGFSHLLVRNDLARSSGVPDPVLVHQAIAESPGLRRVATFGADVGGEAHLEDDDGHRLLINSGWQNAYPAIEVFEVADYAGEAQVASGETVVVGGPEDLLDLSDLGLLRDSPVVLAPDADADAVPQTLLLTDGLRATERHFGRVHDGSSATLSADDPPRMAKPVRDYQLDVGDRWSTTASFEGGTPSASSSMADANALGTVQPGELPYAAVDGDPRTAWVANFDTDDAAWWQLDLDAPDDLESVEVTAGSQEDEVVRLRTEHGVSDPVSLEPGASRTVAIGDSTDWLRVEDASRRPGHRMSLAEVQVPGAEVHRVLALPVPVESWGAPDAIVLRRLGDARAGCATVDRAVRCVEGRDVAAEEASGFERLVTLPVGAEYEPTVTVRARPGNALLSLLLEQQPVGISSSTSGVPDPRGSALAAIDGDLATTWTASLGDFRPELRLSWLGPRRVRGLELAVAPDTAARQPERLEVRWPGGRTEVGVDEDGVARLPGMRTDQLTIRVLEAEPVTSLDFESHALPVPVGISELRVRGLPYLPVAVPQEPVVLPCGSGPTLRVHGQTIRTSVTASLADLYAGSSVSAELCAATPVDLQPGTHRLVVEASATFMPDSVVLVNGAVISPSAADATLTRHDAADAAVRPGADSGTLALRQNVNAGWSARQDAGPLRPVTLDGWRQGWILSGGDEVDLTFTPDRAYRVGLALGLVGLVLLTLVVLRPARRWGMVDAPALSAARLPAVVLVLVATAAGGLLSGWPGAVAAWVCVPVGSELARRGAASGLAVMFVLVAPATVVYALRPWGDPQPWAGGTAWPHQLLVAGLLLPLGFLLRRRHGGATFRRRRPGFSTSR